MRVYGRVPVDKTDPTGPKKWVVVETDKNGDSTDVIITWLQQVLLLNLNESPFFANWGIPARDSVLQQVAPDIFVTLTQQRFAPYFASITISKRNTPTPTYDVAIITKQGAKLTYTFPANVPQ